jgi:chemotaxis protein methyltransferase CheR
LTVTGGSKRETAGSEPNGSSHTSSDWGVASPAAEEDEAFCFLKAVVRRRVGFDCEGYRETYLKRRMALRLKATGAQSYHGYVEILLASAEEREALRDVLAVNATEFFRNPETFDAFSRVVLPRLVHEKGGNTNINIWSAGCATGEEPYSIAMVLSEFFGSSIHSYRIRILATDSHAEVLRRAVGGVYAPSQLANVSRDRLARHFVQTETGDYAVNEAVRALVSFDRHNLKSGRRLHGFDVVFFRNVGIYFEQDLQEEILLRICGALNANGYLVAGTTEVPLGRASKLLESIGVINTIYRLRDGGSPREP